MATVVLASDAGGAVVVSADVQPAAGGTFTLASVTVANTTAYPVAATVTDVARSRTYSQTFPANSTTSQDLRAGAIKWRATAAVDPAAGAPAVDGISLALRWPA